MAGATKQTITYKAAEPGVKKAICCITGMVHHATGPDTPYRFQSPTNSFTVAKVEITPTAMDVIESKDSSDFIAKITPDALSPTFKWLTGSDNSAWPADAGNDPSKGSVPWK